MDFQTAPHVFPFCSTHTQARELAGRFKNTDLHHEYAVLLSRTGRHAEALRIYAHHLKSPLAAEMYCQ